MADAWCFLSLGIKYDDLNQKARVKIWTSFIQRADNTSDDGLKSVVTDKQIQELAQRPSNGRQVSSGLLVENSVRRLTIGIDQELRPHLTRSRSQPEPASQL